jgi:predicted permease
VHLFIQDFRYALRMMRKSPGLTIVIVLSLAIGIGANTAIFSVTDALLLKPLHYPQPDRLAILWLRSPGLGIPQDWPSPGEYIDVKTQNSSFEESAIAIGQEFSLTGLAQPERIEGIRTSGSLFHLFGTKPIMGRTFSAEEETPGKDKSVVLTYGLWRRVFGADPQIVGKGLTLNGNPFTVVGVLGPEFVLNNEVMPTVASIEKIEIFLPLPLGADAANDRGNENFNVMARLKPGVTMRQAQADIDVIAGRIREKDHRDPTFTISVVPLLEQVVGNVRRAVLVLLGSVGLVLLIACANVANLLLSRATSRQKEVAIRTALGASRVRLVRQLLTESTLLGLLGGAAGLIIAAAGLYVVRTINPGNIPRLDEIRLDAGVLVFTFAVSILSGIVFGVAPVFRVLKIDLNSTLKAGGRRSQDDGGLGLRRHGLRGLLVVSELAISLMLLIGAGLLIRSFVRLAGVPPGFNPGNVISMRLAVNGPKYKEPQPIAQFYEQLGENIRRLPGVKAEGAVSALPLTSSVGWGSVTIEGYTPPPNAPELQVDLRIATPDYFQAMQVPLLKGRFFSNSDTREAQQVILVDEKLAQHFWPHDDPVGKRIRQGGLKSPWMNIVGVVGVVKQYGLDTDTRMVVYYPHKQQPGRGMYLVARTTSDPATLAGEIVRQIHALGPDVPVYEIATMQQRLNHSLARQRFSMIMLGAFACFALVLAAVGVYGVMSYLVSQGTHDIGVRMALGAQQSAILRLVVRQGLSLALIGIVAGLASALILTRLMESLLFGVKATDAVTFSLVALLLGLIALLATYVPARRAMRVDPLVALREE